MSKKQFEQIILKFSESQDVDDAMKEWSEFGPYQQSNLMFQCICGHTCQNFRWMVNKRNKNAIRVADVCFKKFVGKTTRRCYGPLNRIYKQVINEGKYKIDNFEEFEQNVKQEITNYYVNKINKNETSMKHLYEIKQELEHINQDRYLDIYNKIVEIITKKTYDINKQKYLLRKKEWMNKGSLCCSCTYPLPSENYIKYDYKSKLWYCPYCFKHLDEPDKLEERKITAQLRLAAETQD